MRETDYTAWALEMADCLRCVAELAQSEDLSPEEIELRLAQYAESAQGHWCPEAAFDPLAGRLRAIARLVSAYPSARADWNCRVAAAMLKASMDHVAQRSSDAVEPIARAA
jgi:hypothetical protein